MRRWVSRLGLLTLLLAATLCSCNRFKRPALEDYRVEVMTDVKAVTVYMRGDTVANTTRTLADSMTMLIYQPEYDSMMVASQVAIDKSGRCHFEGQIDGPHVAMLQFKGARPFYFILEGGNTQLALHPGGWSTRGSRLTADYCRVVASRHAITATRKDVWKAYRKLAADSALRLRDEIALHHRDSLLQDSLQHILVEAMKRDDCVARLVRDRYEATLDSTHSNALREALSPTPRLHPELDATRRHQQPIEQE